MDKGEFTLIGEAMLTGLKNARSYLIIGIEMGATRTPDADKEAIRELDKIISKSERELHGNHT